MADVALKAGLLSKADPAKAAAADREGSFARGLVFGILLSLPAWAAIGAVVYLLV